MSFESCLAVVLAHEGSYTNDPNDPGGITNLGMCINEDGPALFSIFGHLPTAYDMQTLTPEMVAPIYRKNYWDRMYLDLIKDQNLQLCLFDMGVLIGTSGAIKILQGVAGVGIDGYMGPNTAAAVNDAPIPDEHFLDGCQSYFTSRVASNPKLQCFLQGWENRVNDLRSRIS